MDEQWARQIMGGEERGPAAGALRLALAGASLPYAALARLRRWAYGQGVFEVRAVDVPVISVGNLTTGGTGKTPMAAWIVRRLGEAGRRPAVLIRGYKARRGKSDEAQLLLRLCGVPVVVNPDRVRGAVRAIAEGADVLVLDDGFQHRRLWRDLDVVLIDAANPFGFGWCLPRGLLREGLHALRDAGAVVITRSDAVPAEKVHALRRRINELAPGASVHAAVHRPTALIAPDGAEHPPAELAGRRVFAFCGIAQPASFFRTLRRLGAVLAARPLNDHVAYTSSLEARLRDEAEHARPDVLVTTQKDYVKLVGTPLGKQAWQIAMEVEVVQGRQELLERVFAAAGCEHGADDDWAGPAT